VAGWDAQQTRPWARPEALIVGEERDWPESYDIDAEDDQLFLDGYNRYAAAKRLPELTAEAMESMVNKLERLTGKQIDYRSVVTVQKARQELQDHPVAVAAVHGYWYFKRLRLGRPLLREYWQPPAWDDANPFLNFRPRLDTPIARRRKLREERTNHAAAQRVRASMQKAAELVAAVIEREKMKRELLQCDEALLDLELTYAKRPKIEREDFLVRLRNGLTTARAEGFDGEADVRLFRSVFPDPNCTDEEEEEEKEVDEEAELGRDLRHLRFVQWVRLEGVAPFWGVPRLARGGRVVYDPLTIEDIARLRLRLVGELPRRPRVKRARPRLLRVANAILQLRRLSKVPPPDEEEERVSVDENVIEFARERGWLPLNVRGPAALPRPPEYERPKNVVEKRREKFKMF
jgi:hypothetical protein